MNMTKLCCWSLVIEMAIIGTLSAAEAPVYSNRGKLLIWQDGSGKEHAAKTPADWARRRAHILANMEKVMGPLPPANRKAPLEVTVTEEFKGEGLVRKKITYAAEKGDRVPAYLF